MTVGLLQANLNHARATQDLFVHTLMERGCGLGIAAEPYNVPRDNQCWATNAEDSVALHWRMEKNSPPCQKISEDRGFVTVEWGPISVLGCYISPSLGAADFERVLDGLESAVRSQSGRPIIVAGGFNAKSALWGSRHGLERQNGSRHGLRYSACMY